MYPVEISPRTRRYLSADGLIRRLRERFETVDDPRRQASIGFPLADCLTAGFAMFSLKDPSLLAFDKRRGADQNLQNLYGIGKVPSDTQMREIIDPIELDALHECFADIFHELQRGGVLIVTDGIFSMEGTIVDLPGIMALAEFYGAEVLVDDAHSFGVLGEFGGGTAQHFHLEDRVSLIMATFSKSLGSIGGMVAGPEDVIHYLKHHARSLIFSASNPPTSVASTLAALDVIEEEPERREQLWRNTRRMQEGLRALGYNIGNSETPIIPVQVGEIDQMFVFWKQLFDAGVFTNPVTPPAVPENSCRLRISLMATHTDEHIDFVLDAFATIGKKMAVI